MAKQKDFLKTDRHWVSYGMSILAVAAASLFGGVFQTILPSRDLLMFYLLAVVVTALRYGRGPAIMTSFASMLAFDFFFVTPKFSFIAVYTQDWVALAIFLIVGFLISTLMARAKESARKVQAMALLHEKEKLQSVLLSSISHDLRTPLASITGTLSGLLHNKDLDKKTRDELVETAYGEADRLNRLVGNLLDMTRVEAGALNISLKPCDISDLIGASLQQFSKEQIAGRSVSSRIQKELPEIQADFALMVKVLVNVIDNTFKYTPADSPVAVEAKMTDNILRIEVIDQGFGIPEKDLERIFDKFYRVNRPGEIISGSGLGLSICKGIVEAHKGKIWAENQPVRGLKIIIALPYSLQNKGMKNE